MFGDCFTLFYSESVSVRSVIEQMAMNKNKIRNKSEVLYIKFRCGPSTSLDYFLALKNSQELRISR